ncbi:MAG TPA: hypothetical protein VF092_18445 [Longimicrobium sp.]
MDNLTLFDTHLRKVLSARHIPVSDFASDSFLPPALRWRVGPPGESAHFVVVSEEAIRYGTDLVASLRRLMQQFNWPGNVQEHAGKAFVLLSDGSVREDSVSNFPPDPT